jgi:hypothetical protein
LCLSSAGSFSFCCLCSSLTSGPLNESRCEKEKTYFYSPVPLEESRRTSGYI